MGISPLPLHVFDEGKTGPINQPPRATRLRGADSVVGYLPGRREFALAEDLAARGGSREAAHRARGHLLLLGEFAIHSFTRKMFLLVVYVSFVAFWSD